MKILHRTWQARNEEVIAHRYVSKLLNWYQPNNKCDFDKCSYCRQKLQRFEEQNSSASRYPTAKLMIDSQFYIYFKVSPSFCFPPVPTSSRITACRGGDSHSGNKTITASCSIIHGPWEAPWRHMVLRPQEQMLGDEFQREEIMAGQVQYVHRQRKIFF